NPPDAAVLNWGKFFAAKTDEELEQLAMNDPHISRANEALKTLSQDPAARELARQRRLAELAYQSGLSEAEAKGEARGEARGEAKGLREAIEHLCQLFEIELDAARAERFSGASAEELLELHDAIAKQQGWPGAES